MIYYMSDMENREKSRKDLIERRRIINVPTHVVLYLTVSIAVF